MPIHKKLLRKRKCFCENIKNTIVKRKLFFSILFLIFSVFVFTTGTQIFSPYSTFSKTIKKNINQTKPTKKVEDVRAITLFPISDGYYGSFNTSSSTKDHFVLVDEQKCSGEDYVYSDIYQKIESYKVMIGKIPDGSTIKQIDIIPCGAHIEQAGTPAAIQTFYRMDSVNSRMISHILPDSVYSTELEIASWKNLNLLKTSDTTLEIGIQNAGGDRGVKIGNVKMQVRYVPPKAK